MWKELIEFAKQIIALNQDTQHNKSEIIATQQSVNELRQEIKDVRQEMQEQARAIEHLAYQLHRVKETEQHERAMMALRLENEMLKFERRLPSGKSDSD